MKKILIYSLISMAVLGLGGTVLAKTAYAQGDNGGYSLIIQKLVAKFNLNAEDVQKVFDEVKDEMRQEREANSGEKPEKLSCESGLTAEQKEALTVKREELKTEFEAVKDLSAQDRQAKITELKTEMETWATEQGIDAKCLGGFIGFGHGPRGERGFKGDFGEESSSMEK
jgi:polyhydroxyalkanoate synthesis regulator phasin